MRRLVALLATLGLLLMVVPATGAAASPQGTWIVQLRNGVDPASAAPGLARQNGGSVGYVYRHALNGFSFRGSAAAAAALERNPKVTLVEADAQVSLDTTQTGATWGLDRIDQRALPLSGSYTYDQTGAGVTAYIIDTGILPTHQEFGGRASVGTDLVGDGRNGIDCNGHGTHVAGTIGGATYGVAKGVDLVAVRVFSCTGGSAWTTIIAGMDWVIANHDAGDPAVANMSLSGSGSSSVDTATNNLINDGVATAVAAGNGNIIGLQANACNYSPARVPAAMTISATDRNDRKASWANYGNCVDWFAPGVDITSAWYSSTSATNTISGTSMATPHTVGAAALYLETHPTASPAAVRTALYDATTKGVVTSSSTTNNHLLYSLFSGGGGGGTAPTAQFSGTPTSGQAPLAVQFSDTSTGSPTSWSWNFGDGGTSNAQNPSHTYTTAGVYDVTLTATNASGSDPEVKTGYITVTAPPTGAITLNVRLYKVKGNRTAELTWSGASSTNVDVWRNGAKVTTTPNDGVHTDLIGGKGGGTFIYKVCEAGTTTCSPEVSASF
ncbi:MAG TPA: S8 family serine peptidase [Candidatus Limnocylindrales bacterium]|nr:S8 family serine peptidase [Candidatus Limnocylindrales bacterium]